MRKYAFALCALSGLLAVATAQDPRLERVHEPGFKQVVDPGVFSPRFEGLERIAPEVRVLDAPALTDPRLSRIQVEVYGEYELGASDPLGIEFSIRAPTGPTFRLWDGKTGEWAVLLIAAKPACVMFPGYGMVLVDPTAVPFLIPFDANGEIVAPLDVMDPALLGIRFYAQGWAVPSLRPSPGLYLGIEHPNAQPALTYDGPRFSGSLCRAIMAHHKWFDVAGQVLVPTSGYEFYPIAVDHAVGVTRVSYLLVTPGVGEILDPVPNVLNSVAFVGEPKPTVEVWIAKWQRNSSCIEVGLAASFGCDY